MMTVVVRILAGLAILGGMTTATPAAAQFFFSSHDMSGPPVRGDEPGIGPALPGATDDEIRASLIWNLRAALNVAALQCQFEPTLLSVENYNVILINHKEELAKSFAMLSKYFVRTAKTAKAGQVALDQYGTRTYSGFTTVGAQYGFCQTAAQVAKDAAYAPRGEFYKVAINDMSALRNALVPWGEQRFPRRVTIDQRFALPRLDDVCWKRDMWVAKKCGAFRMTRR